MWRETSFCCRLKHCAESKRWDWILEGFGFRQVALGQTRPNWYLLGGKPPCGVVILALLFGCLPGYLAKRDLLVLSMRLMKFEGFLLNIKWIHMDLLQWYRCLQFKDQLQWRAQMFGIWKTNSIDLQLCRRDLASLTTYGKLRRAALASTKCCWLQSSDESTANAERCSVGGWGNQSLWSSAEDGISHFTDFTYILPIC